MESYSKIQQGFYTTVNKRLELECSLFKEKFEQLKKKFTEKKPITQLNSQAYLQNLHKNLKIYKRDCNSLKAMIKAQRDHGFEVALEKQVRDLQSQLNNAQKENERLNRLKLFNSSENNSSDFCELEDEVVRLRSAMQGLTEKNLQTNVMIERNEEKNKELRLTCEVMVEKIGPERLLVNEKVEQAEGLMRKLKAVQCSFNSKQKKLEGRIVELEKELKVVNMEMYTAKTRLFKRNQQKRLIDMSRSEAALDRKKTVSPNRDHFFHPDVNFFYKPSVSRLYCLN